MRERVVVVAVVLFCRCGWRRQVWDFLLLLLLLIITIPFFHLMTLLVLLSVMLD